MDHTSVVAELGPLRSHIVKPWLWTGSMTKLSPGRRQTTNWSDDNVALRKRGSLLIHCPALHACMCDRGLNREMIWRAPHEARAGPKARGRSDGGNRHIRYPPVHSPQAATAPLMVRGQHCRARDSPVLPELPEHIPESEERGTVTADSACDIRRCHTAIIARQASAVIPIRQNGRPWKEDCPATRHSGRAGPEALDRMPCPQPNQSQDARLQGLRRTHRRKDPDRQTAKTHIRIALLNRFNAQGTAEIVRLD